MGRFGGQWAVGCAFSGIKPQAPRPIFSSLPYLKASRLTLPCVGRLSTESISLEDFLDFTSGYEDPHLTIPIWNTPTSACDSSQASSTSFSGSPASQAQHLDNFGSQSINWDVALFSTLDSGGLLSDSTTAFPLTSASSSAALTGELIASNAANWHDYSLPPSGPEPYLGNDSSFTTSEQAYNVLAMSSGMGFDNLISSTPMVKDHSSSGSASSHQNHASTTSSPTQHSHSKLSSSKSSPLAPDAARIEKRRANTMAARRYRQKRVDQVSGLECELKEVKTERDDLKVRCARLEGEVETLRALLRAQK